MVTHRRDFQALEQRRKQAARLFANGETVLASVARQLKVSRQSVCRWYHEWKEGGAKALKAAGRAGRRPRLSAAQLRKVERALRQGPAAHGFSGELWTLPRVAKTIEQVTGAKFHSGHVWKILGSLNWTVQKPTEQAKERNEDKIQYWKDVRWPELKKTLHGKKPGSSSRMNQVSPKSPRSAPPGHPKARPRS
ncbi:MAG: transposase [Acidobacteria bacterium]|nr:transposase [Acidobacteriota bacterium]